jgi:mRNA interferase RelE/StbE
MADYTITFARSARKELERLPDEIAGRILEKIEALSLNPRPAGTISLRGPGNLWRLRVGDYRVVYTINDSGRAVDVSIVRHRREVYRDL